MEQTGLTSQLLAHHDSGSSPTTTGEENHIGIPTSTEFFNTLDLEPPFVKEKRRPEDRRYMLCRLTVLFFLFAARRSDVFEMFAGDVR